MSEKKESLFHISRDYAEIESMLLSRPDDPELSALIEIQEDKLMEKAEKYHTLIHKHAAIEKMIRDEIKRLEGLIPRHKGIQERLKNSLLNAVRVFGPLDGGTWRVNFSSSKTLEIFDEKKLPPWYMEIEHKPKKAEIKKAIKEGEEVTGARIKESFHVRLL